MKKVLERVRDLLELAVSSASEHEARTAALQACRLIRKHGLVISEAEQVADVPQARKSRPQRPSARVRVPLRAGLNGVEAVGRAVRDVALEAASRVTVADVVDVASVFMKRRR